MSAIEHIEHNTKNDTFSMEDFYWMDKQVHTEIIKELRSSPVTTIEFVKWRFNEKEFKKVITLLKNTSLTGFELQESNLDSQRLATIAKYFESDPKLISFSLCKNSLSAKGFEVIAKALMNSPLEVLDLSSNYLEYDGLRKITSLLKDSSLISLNLSNNEIEEYHIDEFAVAMQISHLKILDLSDNKIGLSGFKIIIDHLRGSPLTTLNLSREWNCYTPDKAYDAPGFGCATNLAAALGDTSLTSLNIAGNYITSKGAIALAKAFSGSSLIVLNVSKNYIDEEGGREIAMNLQYSLLNSLNLSRNDIGGAIVDIAAAIALPNSSLTHLNLSTCGISTDGIKTIARSFASSHLISFNLFDSAVNDEGAIELAKGLLGSSLTSLNLSWNQIGTEGITAIADALQNPTSKMANLILHGNKIKCEAVAALVAIVKYAQLDFLGLSENEIRYDCAIEILIALKSSTIKDLNLWKNPILWDKTEPILELIRDTTLTNFSIGHNAKQPAMKKILAQNYANSRARRFVNTKVAPRQ